MHKNSKFFICASGIFVCFFYYGILQEKVTRVNYVHETENEDGTKTKIEERYTYILTLVFTQCLVNYFFAKAMLYASPHGEDKTSIFYYVSSAMTYLLAMVCSNMALQWVSYPTQVIGKSCKPIPIMVLGVLIGRKSYPFRKYLFVLLIVIGVVVFMFKDKVVAKQNDNFGFGEFLLILSLLMDGLTGAVQERIKTESQPTAQQMMLGLNSWATLFLGVATVVTGELFQFCEFVSRHPNVVTHIALLSLTGGLGQLFIYLTVTEFGPLPCSVITTTRKFFTVIGSILFFGNKLTGRQWIGALIVFSGLFLDAFFSKSPPKKQIN